MNQEKNKGAEYDFYGKLPLQKAILLGLQHVFAMFVGNLTPVLIITGACGIASGTEFADVQIALFAAEVYRKSRIPHLCFSGKFYHENGVVAM